jgi:hypothetical protein
MEANIITLKNPIIVGSETIDKLTFARPLRAGDLRGVPINDMCFEHMLLVAGRLCGQPPKVMDKLESEDMLDVLAVISTFLGRGQQTGN